MGVNKVSVNLDGKAAKIGGLLNAYALKAVVWPVVP
jgi:hypothetical protein